MIHKVAGSNPLRYSGRCKLHHTFVRCAHILKASTAGGQAQCEGSHKVAGSNPLRHSGSKAEAGALAHPSTWSLETWTEDRDGLIS